MRFNSNLTEAMWLSFRLLRLSGSLFDFEQTGDSVNNVDSSCHANDLKKNTFEPSGFSVADTRRQQ